MVIIHKEALDSTTQLLKRDLFMVLKGVGDSIKSLKESLRPFTDIYFSGDPLALHLICNEHVGSVDIETYDVGAHHSPVDFSLG